ncbi:hypothetical protein BH10BAC4_BH10BAC4_21050 [soil metagenome]
MNRTRNIFRAVFLLLTVLLLVNLNKKTSDNTATIAEFKFKMIEKIRTDSLDSKHKLQLLLNDTTAFIDSSSHVRKRIHYLIGLLILWGTIELTFLILEKRNYRQ